MKEAKKDNTELWESKQLGASAEFAKRMPPEESQAIDDALGLQLISVRLQKELVESLKVLAKQEGLSYQPFVRQILTRYVKLANAGKLPIHNTDGCDWSAPELDLQPVSIRLQKDLVDRLKELACEDSLGYQPFMRRILTCFVRDHGLVAH